MGVFSIDDLFDDEPNPPIREGDSTATPRTEIVPKRVQPVPQKGTTWKARQIAERRKK